MKLKRKKQRATSAHEANGYFRPYTGRERLIYRYWDGDKNVAADPLVILRTLTTIEGFALETDLKLAETDSAFAPAAFARVVGAARKAFQAKEFSELNGGKQQGLTDSECVQLLVHFAQFIGQLKEAALPFVSSPASTGPPDSDGSTTEPSPACTFSAGEPLSAEASQSSPD